jgi:hypothetical protein
MISKPQRDDTVVAVARKEEEEEDLLCCGLQRFFDDLVGLRFFWGRTLHATFLGRHFTWILRSTRKARTRSRPGRNRRPNATIIRRAVQ